MKLHLIFAAGLLALVGCDKLPASQDAPAQGGDSAAGAELGVVVQEAVPITDVIGLVGSAPTNGVYSTQMQPIMPTAAPASKPRQAGIHTPPPGSSDRVAMMNALRSRVRNEIGGDVVFVVETLRSDGQWAFAILQPTRQDGRPIIREQTLMYQRGAGDVMDGVRTEAIWRKDRGRWVVYAHSVGSTDVWWMAYCGQLPQGVLPGC